MIEITGTNIATYFPGVKPRMGLAEAIRMRNQGPIRCWEHNGLVEGMNAIAVLRYGSCLECSDVAPK